MSELGPEIERCPAYAADYGAAGKYGPKGYASSDDDLCISFFSSPSFGITAHDMGETYVDCAHNQATLLAANDNAELQNELWEIEGDLVGFGQDIFTYLDEHPEMQNTAQRIAAIRNYGKTIPFDDFEERQQYGEEVHRLQSLQNYLGQKCAPLDEYLQEEDARTAEAVAQTRELVEEHQKSEHTPVWTYPEY